MSSDVRPRPLGADRLAELEEERRFLLRSIADLDREHAAGDVDEADYRALRDGYTVRAATVLRAIDSGRATLPAKPPRNWRRTLAVVGTVVVVAAVAGVLVARFSGQRGSGETITGGTSSNRVADLLSEARTVMGEDPGAASQLYLSVLDIDPNNVEALTYAGWLVGLSAQNSDGSVRPEILASAKQLLTNAIEVDPTYPDPYCFLAILAERVEADTATARTRIDQCIANNPPGELRALIDSFASTLTSDPAATVIPDAPASSEVQATTG